MAIFICRLPTATMHYIAARVKWRGKYAPPVSSIEPFDSDRLAFSPQMFFFFIYLHFRQRGRGREADENASFRSFSFTVALHLSQCLRHRYVGQKRV